MTDLPDLASLAGHDIRGRADDTQWGLRRWESAKTTRLNRDNWTHASDTSLNVDLTSHLLQLRNRCVYEASNNPFVAGIIHTWASAVVGTDGPRVDIESDNQDWAEAAEAVWRRWYGMPDVNGMLTGGQILALWAQQLWPWGNYLGQIVTGEPNADGLTTRLHILHPRRLATPPQFAGDRTTALGVKRTITGKPISYFIEVATRDALLDRTYIYEEIPADQIIHGFRMVEPGQAAGVPLLASCLDAAADLRAYDAEVLDAARLAATGGAVLTTNHPQANYISVNESVDIERRTISTMPPGWDLKQIRAEQPVANYDTYRKERQRELGRSVSMPLMLVRLDSGDHNFSSARFDSHLFWRGIKCEQAAMQRHIGRLVDEVLLEAELRGVIGPRPADVAYNFTWDVPPSVNPKDDAAAEEKGFANVTLSLHEALAARGTDFDAHVKRLAKERDRLVAEGLPVPWEASAPTPANDEEETPEPPTARVAALFSEMQRDLLFAAEVLSRGIDGMTPEEVQWLTTAAAAISIPASQVSASPPGKANGTRRSQIASAN